MPKPRRGAHIYRRKGRLGWYAYLDRDHKDISLETEDEAEAQGKLTVLLKQRGLRSPAPRDNTTVAECFGELLTRSKTSLATKSTYETGLNSRRIIAWLEQHGTAYVADVDRALVESYKESRRFQVSRRDGEKKISAARINREIDTWKQAMKIAAERGSFDRAALGEIFVKLREPRPQPHQVGLTMEQIEAFLEAVKEPAYRALFRTVVGTGMRDDEARHMEKSDIQPPWIVVTPKPGWTTKNYRYRAIPVSKETVVAARAFVKAKASMNLDKKAVWKRIQAARKAAKIRLHFSMHDLRRAWASHMLAKGNRIEEISKWLGHADLMTTQRYLRVVTSAPPKPEMLPF